MRGIKLVAIFRVKKELIEEAREVFEALIEPTRKEKGCIEYELFQDMQDPASFVFIEEWATAEDLENHRKSGHLTSARENMNSFTVEKISSTYNLIK